jgi:hypothetical protein
MNNELKRFGRKGSMAYSKYYPGICLEALSKTTKTFSIAGVLVEIQTKDLPDTISGRYYSINVAGMVIVTT